MADWILIACLVRLRSEFDEIAPGRGHASDGSIGDDTHQHEVSDHNPDETGSVPIHDADKVNEVHAIDVDVELRVPGLTMEMVVQFLLARCRSGAEKRLRYIIYNRRIWQAKNGWREEAYKGPSAHTEHAHFSASYESALEASTASWHLEDIAMPSAAEIAKAVWDYQLGNPYGPNGKVVDQAAGTILRYVPSRSPHEISWAKLDQLLTAAGLEAKEVPPTADENAAAVLKALGASEQSADEIAALLAIALGTKAAAVGAALQAHPAA